jgi:hypothetical protein
VLQPAAQRHDFQRKHAAHRPPILRGHARLRHDGVYRNLRHPRQSSASDGPRSARSVLSHAGSWWLVQDSVHPGTFDCVPHAVLHAAHHLSLPNGATVAAARAAAVDTPVVAAANAAVAAARAARLPARGRLPMD